jgi:branched-chain amino acid transport system substrate-binding protein
MTDTTLAEVLAPLGRRRFIAGTAGAAALAALAPMRPVRAATKTIKLGFVSPQTGPLAAFGEADAFTLRGVKSLLADGIVTKAGKRPVEIVLKDSQSNPNRAAEVASSLIQADNVDLMLVSSTPETTNPVSDQCEVNEVPCISTIAPWQPWFFTRGGKPDVGFKYTWHYFWGLEDVIAVYTGMWGQLATDKIVGGLFPNDGDGNAWGDPKLGFPPVLDKLGYKLVDPGRYQDLSDNFSAQIGRFKDAKVEIVTGVVIPPDFTTFWTQAQQQGFRPKIASVGKGILFPVAVEALGDTANNLSSEVWWSPRHPFKSSLTGQSAGALAQSYTTATKKQWTQCLGFAHSLIEVAVDVLKRVGDVEDHATVSAAIGATSLDTVVGRVDWSHGPVKNVAKTPLVGGQWRRGGAFKYDLAITFNGTAPSIPVDGPMQPIT